MPLGIDPTVDYAFKRLFGVERNKPLLIDLLNAVLDPSPAKRVADVEILNPFNPQETTDDKLSVLDLKARDQLGRQFNVEMQVVASRDLPKRFLFYWARLHSQQLLAGEGYDNLQPTISIFILGEPLFRQTPDWHLRFELLETTHGLVFSSDLELHTIELSKFGLEPAELTGPLERWSYFLRHGETLEPNHLPPTLAVPPIEWAMEELAMLAQDEIERQNYESRFKAQFAKDFSVRSARREGELIGRITAFREILGLPPLTQEEWDMLTWEGLHDTADQLARQVREKGLLPPPAPTK